MRLKLLVVSLALIAMPLMLAAQKKPKTPAQSFRDHLASVDKRLLEMAKDFPEDKYGYKIAPESRSFGEVLVHLISGNIHAKELAQGKPSEWGELDAAKYKAKADIVALIAKEVAESEAALKAQSDADLMKNADRLLSVIEHNGEHYGMLVAYYRGNGLVPPASRPKK